MDMIDLGGQLDLNENQQNGDNPLHNSGFDMNQLEEISIPKEDGASYLNTDMDQIDKGNNEGENIIDNDR